MKSALLAIVLSLVSESAFAACTADFGVNEMIKGMDATDTAIATFDLDQARAILDQVKGKLSCTQDLIHPNQITRFARQEALVAFLDQDEDTATQWGILAKQAGEAPFPPGIPDGHPFRGLLDEIGEVSTGGPEGGFLRVPANGAIVLDGHLIKDAIAPSESQNFVQVLDGDGAVVRSFWQEGGVFPNDILRGDVVKIDTPAWWVEPDPKLDPTKPVVVDPAVVEKRKQAAAKKQAELEAAEKAKAAQAQADEKKLAAVRAKAEKEAQKQAIKEQKALLRELKRNPPRVEKPNVPSEWASIDLSDVQVALQRSDEVDDGKITVDCSNLVMIEPRAMLGRLTDPEIECLEVQLRHEERQTSKDRISRVLMADAWVKKEPGRWEGAVRRHLSDIDRSDADLLFIFARYLAKQGPDRAVETLKWADLALQNASQWDGEVYTERVYDLYRLKAIAAQQKWYSLEQMYLANDQRKELMNQAGDWRNATKNYAREWLQYAYNTDMETDTAVRLCVSAAGFADYCQTQ